MDFNPTPGSLNNLIENLIDAAEEVGKAKASNVLMWVGIASDERNKAQRALVEYLHARLP